MAGGLVVVLAAGGGAWWAADRFLIEHVEIADVSAYEASYGTSSNVTETDTDTDTDAATDTEAVITDNSYTSGDTSITISTVHTGSGSDAVTYYVADVVLGDATDLRSAFAKDQFGENITELTSAIAADNSAVFAINGDYYGFRDTGIVIRNGVVYRDEPAREWIEPDGGGFELPGMTIVETKSMSQASEVDRILWRLGARPVSLSKYATGLAALHPELPRNKWSRLLRGPFAVGSREETSCAAA